MGKTVGSLLSGIAIAALLALVSFPLVSAKRAPSQLQQKAVDPLNVKKSALYDNMKLTVVGRLRQVGSVPFTSYVITPRSNFDIFIDENSVGGWDNIKALQYRIVKASGTLRVAPLRKDAGGKVLVMRYTLVVNDIKEYEGKYEQ